jgi:hypothetical protein
MTMMKPKLALMLLIFSVAGLIGMVTVDTQQASAPRDCGSCTLFKKLTHEFEKNVIEAATIGDPNIIPGLLEQYNQDVRAIDFSH